MPAAPDLAYCPNLAFDTNICPKPTVSCSQTLEIYSKYRLGLGLPLQILELSILLEFPHKHGYL